MNTLLTGGCGFVGLNVAEQLLARGETVTIADQLALPEPARIDFARLPGRLEVVRLDVADAAAVDALLARVRPNLVIHMAAITAGAERDAREPRRIASVNFLGTLNLLEAARAASVQRFVYASTGALFGVAGNVAHRLDEELDRPVPGTIYGITKYASERTCLRLRDLWQMDIRVGRLAEAYGRWEHESGRRDRMSLPWQMTRLALTGAEAVLPKAPARDYIYAIDLARALLALADADTPSHALYHLGVESPFDSPAWCERLTRRFPTFRFRESDNASEWTVAPLAPGVRSAFKAERLRSDLGFVSRYPIDAAMDDYLDWLARHEQWLTRGNA